MKRPRRTQAGSANVELKPLEQYEHAHEKRLNNPHVGLVKLENEPEEGKRHYAYDPHLDPQLVWAGKAERASFEVPTIALHVHERIDPKTVLEAVRTRNGEPERGPEQMSMFERPGEKAPLREALDFYKHAQGWSNRLIAGDSLLVMNSLIEKEAMAGKVQTIYLDPPYGIRYGSNFQPFVNRRDVKDGKDEDLTQEPEMIRAFRDTWELEIHSYLTYLRDRLQVARELLHETGSIFVQISDENLHHVREVMDEIFGADNFAALISFSKAAGGLRAANRVGTTLDYLIWYFRDSKSAKYRPLYEAKSDPIEAGFHQVELPNGVRRTMTLEEKRREVSLPTGSSLFTTVLMTKPGPGSKFSVTYEGHEYDSGSRWWGTTPEGIAKVIAAGRVAATTASLRLVTYFDDFPYRAYTNLWSGLGGAADPVYVVQTSPEVIRRCLLMTTDPGDLVFDPTCGSGTTAFVAEQWGRRWITCDTSRVAIALAKQRIMTALYDYYELAHPNEGVASGFVYKTVPHVTLKSIANNPEIREGMSRAEIDRAIAKYADQETLYDQPKVDKSRARVTGPFTVEAVPAPVVKPLDGPDEPPMHPPPDVSAARSGATLRHAEWREELLKTGIRGKAGQRILFSRVEPLAGTRWLHAEAETRPNDAGGGHVAEGAASAAQRVVICFGPEHAPLEQKQVERAWQEARSLYAKPALLVFAAFQFDPEAAKDIDELTPAKAGMTLLKAQMNPDLLTGDLKKKRASNESFWLVGQPDVELRRVDAGEHAGSWQVEVRGFDYYNTKNGEIESGDVRRIALWMLDPDYDDRSLLPRQVFFPMAGDGEGWARLAKSLRAEIDEEAIEAYRGTVSLPFVGAPGQKVAVKVVDDRGIESLRILEID